MSVLTSQCETFRPELVALLDGELPADQAHAVRQHLKSCGDCRRGGEALTKTWDLLGRMETPRLERSMVAAIMTRVREEPAETSQARVAAEAPAARSGWDTGRRRFAGLFVRLSAAAAMLVGALLVRAQITDTREPSPTPAPSPTEVAAQVTAQVTAPAAKDVLPAQMHDLEALRSKFMPREVRFTHECDAPDPVLEVVAERNVETRIRMENGIIMMEKPMMTDLNNN